MYKLLVPAVALSASLACSNPTSSVWAAGELAAETEVQAVRVAKEEAAASYAADRASAEASKAVPTTDRASPSPRVEFDRDLWASNWDRFRVSTDVRSDGDGFWLERRPDPDSGGTRISAHRFTPTAPPPDAAQDAALLAAVKGRLVGDEDGQTGNIEVSVTNHIVVLQGTVGGPGEASEAVRLALNTPGVFEVVSLLTVAK